MRGLRILAFALVVVHGIGGALAEVSSGAASPRRERLDFSQQQDALRAAFRRAAAIEAPGADAVAALVAFAEGVYTEGDDDAEALLSALRTASRRASDPPSRLLARAWVSQFEAFAVVKGAVETLSESSVLGSPLSATPEVRRQALSAARKAVNDAAAAIAQVRSKPDRAILETANQLLVAGIARMDQRDREALQVLQPIWSRTARSAREVAVWLAALRLAADDEDDGKKLAEARIGRLERAIEQAGAFWSSHPAIAETLQTVVELAAGAKLRSRGRDALARLAREKSAPDRLKLADLAWRVDDLPAGRRWFIEGLRELAAASDANSEAWRDSLQARVDFTFGIGHSTRRLLGISALLDQPDIVPDGSPARRLALNALAQGYAEAGEPRVAAALVRTAAAMALPAKTAALLQSADDPQELEKAGTDFESTPDLGARIRLLEAAFELRRARRLPVDESFVALRLLIEYKIKAGAVHEDVAPLVQAIVEHLRQTPLPPVSLAEGYDSDLGRRQVGLQLLADKLDGAQLGAEVIRLFLQELLRERLRETVLLQARAGKLPGDYLYRVDDVARGLVVANRLRPALELYVKDALPIMLASGTRPLRSYDVNRMFSSLAKTATLLGEIAFAQEMTRHVGESGLNAPAEPVDQVCRRLAAAARRVLASRGLANPALADLVWEMAVFPCEEGPPAADVKEQAPSRDTSFSDWSTEEQRLRTFAASAEAIAAAQPSRRPAGCSGVGTDERRRSLLQLLDEERANTLRNEVREVELLEALAGSYPGESAVSLTLRRNAVDLLLDRTAVPLARIGDSVECLLHSMIDAGQEEHANTLVAAVDGKVRERNGEDGVETLRNRLKPVLQRLGRLPAGPAAAAEPAAPSGSVADLERAVADLQSRPAEVVQTRVVALATLVHGLDSAAYRAKRTHELLAAAHKAVAAKAKPGDASLGMIQLLRAESELTSGTVANALGFIEQAAKSRKHPGWNDSAALDLNSRFESLQRFAQEATSARQQVRMKARQLDQFAQRKPTPGELAVGLEKLMEDAIEAHDYQVAVDTMQRLARVKVPFEDRDGSLARGSLAREANMTARRCTIAIPVVLGGIVSPIMRECAIAAVRMAAIVAADQLREKREDGRDEEEIVKTSGGYDLREVFTAVPPLLAGIDSPMQDELLLLLRWFVAERSSSAALAVRGRAEDATEGKAPAALRAWRKARANWLVQEGQYQCSLAGGEARQSGPSEQAKAARLAAEQAWSDLMASMPPGEGPPRLGELDVGALRRSLRSDEAILSYAVDGTDVVIWVIRQDSVDLRIARWETPQQDVNGLRGQLTDSRSASGALPLRMEEARRIYEALLAPVRDRLSGIHALLIEADATTARVPFAALVASPPPAPVWSPQDTWTPDWLARHFAVSLIPSVATFAVERIAPQTVPRPLLAAGNPIDSAVDASYADDACWAALGKPAAGDAASGPAPGAQGELADAVQLAGSRAALLARQDFVPERLRELRLRDFGLVIFATHGEVETSRLPARLLMSPRDLQTAAPPTLLTANELVQLEFDADLVILSACNSALSVVGELNGLVTGLLRGGARQVLATGWPVAKDIAGIVTLPMVRHYLQNGARDFDRALQAALVGTFDSNSQLRHPYFWAGIILVGRSHRF